MKSWKIYVTFFKKLYDEHYSTDDSLNLKNFTFVKVNDEYEMELSSNNLDYDIFFEHEFKTYNAELQKKGYHQNSVLYHLYKNNSHKEYDYIGFIEYDHVLTNEFCKTIQTTIDDTDKDQIFFFNTFNFSQLWDQGILMNPYRLKKQEGNPRSKWNCIKVILDDYNNFFDTNYTLQDLAQKNCFPICHAALMPSNIFEKIMKFHAFIIESGKVEKYHRFNWRSNAGLMERYFAVELVLEKAKVVDFIQLEHREMPIKVMKPEWKEESLLKKLRSRLWGKI
ncbi:hypothetical protein [Desulfobacula sp.]|uniref:hypothetical protein n=1 Tax=Desulfobacula sp. TaxID=2593537 RepID=UPI001EB37A10|nr:hypothetical protein [Desulfobacula sp.]